MSTPLSPAERALLLEGASSPDTTPFDYIVIGSGAGGGPLAARLALAGQRVLVLEAGVDPALPPGAAAPPPESPPPDTLGGQREVYTVPALHGASTEDPECSWQFSVRHFGDLKRQQQDSKYDPAHDPSTRGQPGHGGIQYPRAAALGGCTSHHAMIIIRPNDVDWDRLAEKTNDPSWRSEHMQGYFAKIENCLYYAVYRGFLGRLLGGVLRGIQWVATAINPRRQLDPGGHGFNGWQQTSFIDPLVVAGIAFGDRTFLSVLRDVVFSALGRKGAGSMLKRALAHLQVIQFLDPNVRSPDLPSRERLSLISIGTDGKRRTGLREHLLQVARQHPKRLVIETGVHAERILFKRDDEKAPRAIGVAVAVGTHLYQASPRSGDAAAAAAPRRQYFARREVIVCGGAFNSPQLLMLSGIGDAAHLKDMGIQGLHDRKGEVIAPVVNLPGVGANLLDRYEVTVVSEAKTEFSTLKGVSFAPETDGDPARQQWLKDGTGLYSTNGGALAFMMTSQVHARTCPQPSGRVDPDLFVFGAPAAFRGYYWGWSKELLRRTKGAPNEARNLWSWVILKAYTRDNGGMVRLRSADPFQTPDINFNSFPASGDARDVEALCEAVQRVREVNRAVKVFGDAAEVQPGQGVDGNALTDWVKNEAWGHHACGTCRIGGDAWQADVGRLQDQGAVLDSRFRVHGVRGLRVVDASVFPEIPGYFIVTPVFMIGEKAADTLLADVESYPAALESLEAEAVLERRRKAHGAPAAAAADTVSARLPQHTTGLALSGGGIRSATFCLGVLQALATLNLLRRFDFLSGVSGGGFIAAFLGRLYTRLSDEVKDQAGRVSSILAETGSPELWWLRRNANYVGSGGRSDLETNLAVFLRNLVAVHFCIGALLFGVFGLLHVLARHYPALPGVGQPVLGVPLSFWWWLPPAVLLLGVLPLGLGYWLVPGTRRPSALLPYLLWLTLLGSAVYALGVPGLALLGAAGTAVLLLAWLAQELAHLGAPAMAPHEGVRTVVRNRLTRGLGAAVLGLVASVAWVVLDSLSGLAATEGRGPIVGAVMVAMLPLFPMLRTAALKLFQRRGAEAAARAPHWARRLLLNGLAFTLAATLLFFLDTLAHFSFQASPQVGTWLVATALAAALLLGRFLPFLNQSSLQQSFAQKLVRTFLGASNPERVHPAGTDGPLPVNVPDADDDMAFDDYHPERHGGPLHLVNVCVNDTVDQSSGRQLRQDKGLPMCVGPAGISVGLRHHALWQPRGVHGQGEGAGVGVEPVRVVPDPHAFHVLARRDGKPVAVERLRLGQWTAISGAAFTTGLGRNTMVATSLLFGLVNLRLGYWWNSGIAKGQRPGRFPPGLYRRLKALPATLFKVQATLLNEWRAYFPGAADRLWYLSDGGHFDNTGLYELLRRRLDFIVAVDGAQDERYEFEDLAVLTRQVRLDFGAELQWLDPAPMRAAGRTGWEAFDALPAPKVPDWVRKSINPDALGAQSALARDCGHCSALAHVAYADDPGRSTWILLIKASLLPCAPVDVRNYAVTHPTFPNQPTADQFFDDDQWESYRRLGQCAGQSVFVAEPLSPGEPPARHEAQVPQPPVEPPAPDAQHKEQQDQQREREEQEE